jgi:UDP-N-acetylmuramate--alanine ligase
MIEADSPSGRSRHTETGLAALLGGLLASMTSVPHIHFVGIGGIGMSGLAQALLDAGYPVSGCDRQPSHITDSLAALGATIYAGHSARHLAGTDLLVVSSAIPPDNPDLLEAQRRHVPVVKRAKLLGHLVADRRTIAVAGTHGKTTTTGMIAWVLMRAGRDPTVFAGGELVDLGSNARRGNGIHAVVEADEYDRAFLELAPAIAVITNIEVDHPDMFANLAAVIDAFAAFLDRVEPGGHIIACSDSVLAPHADLRRLLAGRANVTTYGIAGQRPESVEGPVDKRQLPADWLAHAIRPDPAGQTFAVSHVKAHGQESVGEFRISLPGLHNVSNALAAIAATSYIGIGTQVIAEALASFRGTRRRFEVKGTAPPPAQPAGKAVAPPAAPVTVIDDYAHHPTEIRATLAAVRQRYGDRRVWAIFQPHTYSRTRALLDEFAASFADADRVIVTDIYPAREEDTLGVSVADLVDRMRHVGAGLVPAHIPSLPAAATYVADQLLPGDIVVTLGAGDVWQVGDAVLKRLEQ